MKSVRLVLKVSAVVLFLGVGLPRAGADEVASAGRAPLKIRIPMEFKSAGAIHPKGAYQVRIESGTDGAWVVLLKADGSELSREMAIVQPLTTKGNGSRASVEVLSRDEHMVRVVVREAGNRYLAYFETTV